ncbi:MAG: hypothetical protein Q9218_005208 [Villophora microphyllina]
MSGSYETYLTLLNTSHTFSTLFPGIDEMPTILYNMGLTKSSLINLPMPTTQTFDSTSKARPESFSTFFIFFLIPLVTASMLFSLFLIFSKPGRPYLDSDLRYVIDSEEWMDAEEEWALTPNENTPSAPRRYNTIKEGPLSPEEVQRLEDLIFSDAKAGKLDGGKKRKNDLSVSPRTRKMKIEGADGGVWVGGEYGSCADEGVGDEYETPASKEGWVYPFSFRAAHPDREIKRKRNQLEGMNDAFL